MPKTIEKLFVEMLDTFRLLMNTATNASKEKAYMAINGPKNTKRKNEDESKRWAAEADIYEEVVRIVEKAAYDFSISNRQNLKTEEKIEKEKIEEKVEEYTGKFCVVKTVHTNKLVPYPKFEVYRQDFVKEERGMKIVERDFSILSEATERCNELNKKEK